MITMMQCTSTNAYCSSVIVNSIEDNHTNVTYALIYCYLFTRRQQLHIQFGVTDMFINIHWIGYDGR
jgi:hypothetical protein